MHRKVLTTIYADQPGLATNALVRCVCVMELYVNERLRVWSAYTLSNVFLRIVLGTCRGRGGEGGESQEVAVSYV